MHEASESRETTVTIPAHVLAALAERQARFPLQLVKAKALDRPTPPNGRQVLGSGHVSIVAELDAAAGGLIPLAEQYEAGGAAVIAVSGAPGVGRSDSASAAIVDINARTQVPLLSLEPVISSYQLWEARLHGASLVLLRASVLTDDALVSLVERAGTIGLTAVVEVCGAHDLVRALRSEAATLLLHPARRVHSGSVQSTLAKLLPLVPPGIVRIARSGSAAARSDLITSAKLDADAMLVGSPQLVGGTPRETIAALVALGSHPAVTRGRAASG